MDLTSLKNIANYTATLTDYLGGKNDYFSTAAQNLLANSPQMKAANEALEKHNTVSIALSDEAQKLLAAGTTDGSGKSTVTGVQKTAQNFMLSFFDQAGVDLGSLSEDALNLIEGLQDVIGATAATDRDITTDLAEGKYNPDQKVYTLAGNGARLRLAIQYTDGAPSKLSITDITGGQVETAQITLQSENGKLSAMTIDRTQRQYENGHMTTVSEIEPLSIKLYATA